MAVYWVSKALDEGGVREPAELESDSRIDLVATSSGQEVPIVEIAVGRDLGMEFSILQRIPFHWRLRFVLDFLGEFGALWCCG